MANGQPNTHPLSATELMAQSATESPPDESMPPKETLDDITSAVDSSPQGGPEEVANMFASMQQDDERAYQQQHSATTLRSVLSGARSLTPLLGAVTRHPGLHATQEELEGSLTHMLSASRAITDHAMDTLSIPDTTDNAWAKAMLMQLAASGISEQWQHHHDANPNAWLSTIDAIVTAGVVDDGKEYPDVQDQTAYQVSQFSALSSIAAEIRRFNYFFDRAALLERCANYMTETVLDSSDYVLEGVAAQPADRLMVQQGMLKHAGSLFSNIYRQHADSTREALLGGGREAIDAFIKDNRPRLAIEEIRQEFDSLFGNLVESSRRQAEACMLHGVDKHEAGPSLS